MKVRFSATDQEIQSFVTSIWVSVVLGMAENKSINVRTRINTNIPITLLGGYRFLRFLLLRNGT